MQGYVTIATGHQKYVQMARYLAMSIRVNDPTRPIALLTDEHMKIEPEVDSLFDHIVRMPDDSSLEDCLVKLRLPQFTPFEQTLFIDADCLLARRDIDRHWKRFVEHPMTVAGSKARTGVWHGFDVAERLKLLQQSYMVRFNAGAIYFDNSEEALSVFQNAIVLRHRRTDVLSSPHRLSGLNDEPFLGAAMGMLGRSPIGYTPAEGSLMVTTVSASRFNVDPVNGVNMFCKPTRYRLFGRYFRGGWVQHQPTITHFIGLKPRRVYSRACRDLAEAMASRKYT